MRDVCSADMLANRQVIGDAGHIVAVDDSVIARKSPEMRKDARYPSAGFSEVLI
jgi:hypothetical protein